jgi:hypothetical protein
MTTNPYLNVRCAFALAKIASIVDTEDDSFCVPRAEAEQLATGTASTIPMGI